MIIVDDRKELLESSLKRLERIRELEKENHKLKERIAEYDDLTEELDFWKREAKRLGWKPNLMEDDTIKELKDIGEF